VQIERNERDRARLTLDHAIAVQTSRMGPGSLDYGLAVQLRGELHWHFGELPAARRDFAEALAVLRSARSGPQELAQAERKLATANTCFGDLREARAQLESARRDFTIAGLRSSDEALETETELAMLELQTGAGNAAGARLRGLWGNRSRGST